MKQVLRSRRLRTGRSDFKLLASATDSNGTECQCTKTGQADVARFGDGWRTIIWICCGERSGSSRFVEDGGQPRNCTTQSTKLHLDPADLVSAYQVRKGGSLGCGHGGIDSEKRQNRSDCVTVRNERHGSVSRIASGVDCVARGKPGFGVSATTATSASEVMPIVDMAAPKPATDLRSLASRLHGGNDMSVGPLNFQGGSVVRDCPN